ncbi:MAG: cadherin-like domain-containing protein [Dechloromonas sp.]|nr:cadherin-like domain-containing protein [Dechloromonas sp.]
MANQLTQLDLDILKKYADQGDRKHYWSYLAEKGDPYAALALGVVLNNTPPGQVANNFFWSSYQPNSQAVVDEKELNRIGVDLMQEDFKQRSSLFNTPNGAMAALYLPALNIFNEHKIGLPSIDYWTPAGLLKPFFEGPNLNIPVGQKIWDAFIQLGKDWSANPSIGGALGATDTFLTTLYRLDGLDDRVWSANIASWAKNIFLPGALATLNMAQSFAGTPNSIQGWTRDVQTGQWYTVESPIAPGAIGVKLYAPPTLQQILDANRQFRLDQINNPTQRDPRDRWSREGLKVAYEEIDADQIPTIGNNLTAQLANTEFAAYLRDSAFADAGNGGITDALNTPVLLDKAALDSVVQRELAAFVNAGAFEATVTETGQIIISGQDREVRIGIDGTVDRLYRQPDGREIAETANKDGTLLSRNTFGLTTYQNGGEPVLIPVITSEYFQGNQKIAQIETVTRPNNDVIATVSIQSGQSSLVARYENGAISEILGARIDGAVLSTAALATLRDSLPGLSPEQLVKALPEAASLPASTDLSGYDLSVAQVGSALLDLRSQLVLGTDYYGNPTYISKTEANLQTVANGVGSLIDALSLIKAIQSGQPLPIVASGLRLAADLDYLDGTRDLPVLGAAASIAGSVLSLYSLSNALEQGDGVGAITSAAYAVKGVADAAQFFQTSGLISEVPAGLQSAGNVIGEALPYLNLVNSIAHGDKTGTAVAVVDLVMMKVVGAYTIPVLGWAYAIYNLIDSLFGDEPEIPDPWGNGYYQWDGHNITYRAAGETGGKEAVENVMASTLATLNALIERERQQNPGSQLGIIPNRMPTVGYDMSGYRYTDIDPLSGAEKHPALRFDTAGNPWNAEPGSPESYQSIIEGMVRSALSRGAIAPLWEVRTAKLQTDAGDPRAGLSEEERAGRDGQLAAPLTGASQTFRPVALDLDGDGIEVTDKANGVAFDVDDSGYLKQTAWIKGDDAMLVLDRNYNGQIDSGRELFSNSTVALGRRGLAGMAWVDANYDGKLTSADPVWEELKLWRDLDQNGNQDAGEVQTLEAAGITELNYAMGTFTQHGVKKQLGSPDLEADSQGTRVSVVPEGILVQRSEDGRLSLVVTRIDDKTAVEANRDGVSGYEDVEIIVSTADLLANDTLGGIPGRDLTVTGLTNFRHGTGFIDANGFVHFMPEANYFGDEAGFDYVVRATNGQEGTATVDITLQNVNDAPTLDHVARTTRPVYGYTPVVYSATDEWGNGGQYVSGGNPIYTPYAIHRTNDWDGNTTETIVYNPPPGQWYYEYHTTPIASEDSGTGQVHGADVDDPVSSLSYEIVNQPQYGAVSLNADGSFQYTSWKEPGVASDRIVYNGQYAGTKDGTLYYPGNLPSQAVYPTTDVFQIRITDPHGASTIQSISVPHYGPYLPPTPPGGGGGGKKPIAVDLNGNGFEFVNVDDSNVFFDVNGDGWKRRTSWVGQDDGLLAYDIDGDGKIDKPGEISFARYKDGAQSDLEGLQAFDSNGDGRFDAADEKWAKFGVWQDANQNGVTDPGEFRTLSEMGITAVNLASDGQFQIINGQTVKGVGSMTRADGSEIAIADVTFAYSNETQVPQTDGTMQTVNVSPFSPSGEEINGTEDKDLILGKNGNNIIKGYGGDDVIFEDGGNDIIDGGEGNDLIYSGADNDLVMGGTGDDVVYAGLGNDIVFGGEGHDALFGEGGNDILFGGAGNDLISGGWGNDVLSGDDGDDQLFGEAGNDALFGGAGDDELFGMEGNDYLNGGAGNDLLDGGAGADEMAGGAGDDIYVVDDADDTVIELANEGNDTVRTTLDGYTLGANVENLTLTGSADLAGHGNELDNVLIGNRGNNTLTSGAGNDKLDGGLGADTLIGGTGDDTYVVDNIGDTVVELAGEGIDTVKAGVSYALAANVENLILTGAGNIDATGNELDNRLTGNAGDNRLDGGAGADVMAGGRGNDIYVVDQVGDVVIENVAEGIDTVISGIDHALGANVENLTLSGSGDLHGIGNELDNVIVGNAGHNVLDGGAGADTLAGGAGDDTYVVDHVGDTVIEVADGGTDSVLASVTYTLSANVENLTLTGSANIDGTGNELANVLIGNTGANHLDGGAGADVMAGGIGDDTYVVDDVGDVVREFFGEGTDLVLASVSFVLPEHVENLTLTGNGAIDGTGNALDNILIGNDAANVLDGAAGDDTMIGGTGDDIYYVDSLGDRVIETTNGGYDTVRTTVSLTVPDHVERIELLGSDNIDATGNALDNVLVGNAGNNRLDGGAGADVMIGGAGDDIYIVDNVGDTVAEAAQEGTDTVFASVSYALSANVENLTLTGSADINATGNELANTLLGNGGRNILDGGAGADTMAGGAGNDDYIVDNAGDTVVEAFNAGIDTIYTSVSYVLPENVENLILTGNGNIDAGGNGADNTLIGNAGDNFLAGGGGSDRLDGQAGNDTLHGGQGNDVLIGGVGNDTYLINLGDGLDWIDDVSGNDTVRFGTGLSLENVALRITEANGVYTAHVRVLNAGGCEQPDQGFDFAVAIDRCGRVTSPIEQFQFADGNIKTFDDLLIKTRITYGTPWASNITTGRDDDIIVGGPRNNVIRSGSGNDIVYAGAGGDTVYGEGGDDYLQGGTGNDTLDGGCGIDVLSGSTGRDTLRDMGGNNALFGGAQNDHIEAGAGNDFIAGGKHDDTIQAGAGANVIAFNWGDGRDIVLPGVGASNTLSLGGGIDESDLMFKKSGSDLILTTGGSNQITLKDWYASIGNQTVDKLQVVEAVPYFSWGQINPTGWDVETFDFKALVQKFDEARTANPKLSQWKLMNGLLDAHLSSSDSAALGGELATRYAAGGESAISLGVAQDTLKDAHFGNQAQTVGSRFDSSVCGYRLG